MAFYNHVPAPDGFRHCPRCQTVKPLADFEPSPKRACGISQSCHICLVTGREERADVRQIVEEAAARMLEIQFRSTTATSTPRKRAEPSERLTDDYFRSLDAARRRKRLRIFGQGAAVTSQDITEAAERGDIAEPDAITLFRMLRDDAARERAEADRADSQADRQRERAEANVVDSLTADIMAPVYTGKRTPEQARALMLSRLRQVPSAIARRAIAEMTPALNALESASEQTPQARDTLEHMDDQDRRVFMGSALQGIGAIRRKQVVAEAGNLMDQAIQRTQRDISRGVLPVDARERAYQWLKMELGALRLRHRRPLPAGTPGGKSYGFGDFLTNVWGDLTS